MVTRSTGTVVHVRVIGVTRPCVYKGQPEEEKASVRSRQYREKVKVRRTIVRVIVGSLNVSPKVPMCCRAEIFTYVGKTNQTCTLSTLTFPGHREKSHSCCARGAT